MKDGKVVGDRENDTDNYLDYQLGIRYISRICLNMMHMAAKIFRLMFYSDGLSEGWYKEASP